MAMLSDLVRVIAEATGDPESTVNVVARSLREAGLIATGGRGRSAAKMSPHDAASLLLGVCSPGDSTKAAETVRAVSQLKLERNAPYANSIVGILLEDHEDELGLKSGQPLHECLSSLLERLMNPPEEVAPQAEPKAELRKKPLFKLEPFKFSGDTWPSSVGLEIIRDSYGLRANLPLYLRGGDMLTLGFSPRGESRLLEQINRTLAMESRGKHVSIKLDTGVAYRVVGCLRDLSRPSPDDKGAIGP